MKMLLMAAALCLAPVTTRAQTVVGTDPNAATLLQASGYTGQGITQTFIAKGPQLTRLSFWFYGGQGIMLSNGWQETFFSQLYVDEGPYGRHKTLHQSVLSQASQGRVDVLFSTPISMTMGNIYSFSLYTNNAGDDGCAICAPIGSQFVYPRIEMTQADAFGDGFAAIMIGELVYPGDIRFEAEFSVPEPDSVLLLLTAFVPLYYRARKRRSGGMVRWKRD